MFCLACSSCIIQSAIHGQGGSAGGEPDVIAWETGGQAGELGGSSKPSHVGGSSAGGGLVRAGGADASGGSLPLSAGGSAVIPGAGGTRAVDGSSSFGGSIVGAGGRADGGPDSGGNPLNLWLCTKGPAANCSGYGPSGAVTLYICPGDTEDQGPPYSTSATGTGQATCVLVGGNVSPTYRDTQYCCW
jgi:hypothetical protein